MAVAVVGAAAADGTAVIEGPPPRLPPLREDVRLQPGPPTRDGAPTWTLYDPALHRFVRIGRLEFEILCRWGLGRPEAIAASVSADTPFRCRPEDVGDVAVFAQRARLLQPMGEGGIRGLVAEANAHRLSPAMWLLKNYLFIRVRLIDPDSFLAAGARMLGWMFTRRFATALGLAALLGLYLISRQWDSFTHAFLHLFTLQGALMVGAALAFSKAIHELGHGLMARRFGCRVPGMGFALLVLWPMLWTDVTDAWRLTDRHKRLLIDAAGVMAEITLAIFASLAWSVLPDGSARTAAFMLASSTWLITLAVNTNPLMRFDGYFLLSDWLDEPNLQERSFAMARWRLRRLLFGFNDRPPESMHPRRRRLIVAYAIACWIYRFTLFLGIALLVYHLTFKLLGLFLMAVEIGWFLVRPIMNELLAWPRLLHARRWPKRMWLTLALFAAVVAGFVTPWHVRITAPALLRAERQTEILIAEPGQLLTVSDNGRAVAAGQALFTLASPDVAHAQAAALAEIGGLRARLAGQAFDPDAAQDLPVAWQQLEGALAQLRGAEARQSRLTVRAPFAGTLVDVPRGLAPGVWLPKRERLGMLVDFHRIAVEALVDEADVARVRVGAAAEFIPEDGEAPLRLTVQQVSPGALADLDAPELASVNGGGVPARPERNGVLKAETAVYRVMLVAADGSDTRLVGLRRGTVRIAGDSTSFLARVWRRATALVMREAGL